MNESKGEGQEVDWLKRWNLYAPEAIVLKDADNGNEFTYRDFYFLSCQIAIELSERFAIERGDRVAVFAPNEVEYFFLFFALQRLGAIMVPVNFRLTAREVSHILQDSEAKLLISHSSLQEIVDQLTVTPEHHWPFDRLQAIVGGSRGGRVEFLMRAVFEDPCMILYTSGTTGAPKGALITHKMIFWNAVNTSLRLNLSQTDVSVSFLPFFHTGGWNVLNTPLLHRGGRIVFVAKFEPERILRLCESERVTILFGVPTTMEMMRQTVAFEQADLSSVRYAVVGGEPMPIELIEIWQERGVPIRQGYGLTEFGPGVFSLNEEDSLRKIGSIGFPNFYVDAKIVDGYGHEVTAGEVGELALRGPACTPGYWRNEQATFETLRDGWLYTGDLVRQDSDGYYYVVGRKKDMYISGGENVYPVEIENFLRTHPAISEAAVIGIPDAKWGEVGKAFVIRKPGHHISVAELQQYCAGRLAKFKMPAKFEFLENLPKGDSGKILKRELPRS